MSHELLSEPSLIYTALRAFLGLAAVLILAYLILNNLLGKLLKKQKSGQYIQICEKVCLDNKKALYLVEIAGQRFLLGAADNSLALISPIASLSSDSSEVK